MKLLLLKNIQELLCYNKWANERLIKNIETVKQADYYKDMPIPFKNIHGLLSHLYYYDAKYYKKIFADEVAIKNDKNLSREVLAKNLLELSNKWSHWIDDLVKNNCLER